MMDCSVDLKSIFPAYLLFISMRILFSFNNTCILFFSFQSTQKSIDSNDTAHSDSTTVAQTTTGKESNMRENGNGGVNHVHGSTGNGSLGVGDGANNSESRSQGLNLTMSAKELREMLAQRKKYDPKKESIGFKDKFDIVQKL